MADHTLGTIRGTIEIDYDGAGVVKAIKDTDQMKSSGDRLSKASSGVLSSFAKFGKGALVVGGAISAVNSTAGLLVGTLAVAGPLAAAAFAAAPAVILGYQAALIVTKLAIAGVGDALKAAGGDQKKFDEALKKLSPQAKAFAQAFRTSLPVLKAVQQSMQDAFFKGTAGQVAGVVSQVAKLKPAASAVAGTMGQLATEIVKTATSGKNIDALKAILNGVNAFLLKIKGSIGPVVTGFLNLAKQGAAFGGAVGGNLANALANLANWLNTIDLKQIFAEAGPIVQALGQFLGDVATIAKELFGIFIGDGQNAAGILGTLASNLANFLQSAQGQAAIGALRDAMAAIGGAVGQIFLTLLQALAPAIVALAPGAGQLATQIAGVLVPAITALSPLLTALAGFLSENMSWLGPLAGAIGVAAVAYKAYAAATLVVTAAKKALNSQMALSAAAWVRNAAAATAAKVAMLASAAATGGAAVAAWIANTAAVVANAVATTAAAVASKVIRGAMIAWTAVQWALNAALAANPIGLVVLAIAALVAGLIYAYKNSETFRNIVNAVWASIKVAIGAVVSWITGTVWPSLKRAWQQIQDATKALWSAIQSAWNAIKSGITTANNAIRNVIRAVWNAIVSVVRSVLNTIKSTIQSGFNAARSVVNTVMNGIRTVVRTVWAAIVSVVRTQIAAVKSVINGVSAIVGVVRGHFNRAKSAIQQVLSSAVSVVRQFPGKVGSALSGLGSLLFSKGKALIQGFINGIKSMAGSVKSAASNIVSSVAGFLPGSPAKEGPLSGKGYVLKRGQRFMNDFATGIKSGSAKPSSAVLAATNHLARKTVPTTTSTRSTWMREMMSKAVTTSKSTTTPATGSSTATRTYNIRIGEKQFATLVVDAVTGNPVAVANAVAEGNRQKSWVGSRR